MNSPFFKNNLILFLLTLPLLHAQNVLEGTIKNAPKDVDVRLEGYNATDRVPLGKTKLNQKGYFSIKGYDYEGIANLVLGKNKNLFLVLNKQSVTFTVDYEKNNENPNFTRGDENRFMYDYIKNKVDTDRKKGALDFQKDLYKKEDAFYPHLKKESNRINEAMNTLENAIKDNVNVYPYATLFLSVSALVTDLEQAQEPAKIDEAREALLTGINFQAPNFYRTGTLERLLFNYVIARQRQMGNDRDGFENELKKDMDKLFEKVDLTTENGQKVMAYLIDGLEKMGMSTAIDHLLSITDNLDCDMSETLSSRVNAYKNVRIGTAVPDVRFTYSVKKNVNSLSQITKKHKETLIIFWASWCSHCQTEMPKLAKIYAQLTGKGMEVVAISADTDKNAYSQAIKDFKWINYCDYKKWNSPPFKSYNVYATPSLFVVDKNMKLSAKYTSVSELAKAMKIKI